MKTLVIILINLHLVLSDHYKEDEQFIESYEDLRLFPESEEPDTTENSEFHLFNSTSSFGECPASHPFIFDWGHACCNKKTEKVKPKKGGACDGGELTRSSKCCQGKSIKCQYTSCVEKDVLVPQDDKKEQIKAQIESFDTVEQFTNYLNNDSSINVLQWELLLKIIPSGETLNLSDPTISWIYNDKNTLENILTSGDIKDDKNWKNVIDILATLINQDPDAAKIGLKHTIAVAISLVFADGVKGQADGRMVDGIARYHTYVKWAEDKIFMEPFYKLNVWEMRFVVANRAQDDELIWARNNVPDQFKTPTKICGAVFDMVDYKGGADYEGNPKTMEMMAKYGGVCGTFCRFGSSMVGAFGIPATPMGQPGHCAFAWLNNGKTWELKNKIRTWDYSHINDKNIAYTWKKAAPFMLLMDTAQRKLEKYRLSEKMRVLSAIVDPQYKFPLLEEATNVCPENYDVYNGIKSILPAVKPFIDYDDLEQQMASHVKDPVQGNSSNLALWKKVATNSTQEKKDFMVRGGIAWFAKDEIFWIEIDLEQPSSVESVSIKWKKDTYISYDVLAEIDNNLVKVTSNRDEDRQGRFSNLPGWDGLTRKVRFEMVAKPSLTGAKSNATIAIFQIVVMGKVSIPETIVSLHKNVTSNVQEGVENLVDGNEQTVWKSNERKSWINIDFGSLCWLKKVSIDWVGDVRGKQTIDYQIGGESNIKKQGKFGTLVMSGTAGSINISLTRSSSYEIRQVSALGVCYTINDVFKMKITEMFQDPESPIAHVLIEDMEKLIDAFEF